MAEDDKKRYEVEMANYTPGQSHLPTPSASAAAISAAMTSKEKRTRKKRTKDPNAPKRSMSAFFWYSQEERSKVRAANPKLGVGDIAKELGRRWGEADSGTK